MVKSARTQAVLAGALGGLVVLILGAILIATGIIDTGDQSSDPIISQSPIVQPAVDEDGDGSTVNEIYRRAQRGVAFIEARGRAGASTSPFGMPDRGGAGSGSGFVINDEGFIVTNAHLVEGARSVRVRFGEPGEDESVDARLVGADPSTDIAVLKVDMNADELEPLPLGDSSKLRVGDPTIAIGNPFGFDQTVTTGIVSALQRQIPAPNNFSIDDVIQTDASVNPGNSGGPLLDAAGRVIGVNSQIATGGSEGSVGIGFAVPVNTVKEVVPQLEEDGKIERPYIGVTTAPVADLARDLDLPANRGALVQDVQPGSPAARAGLRAGRTRTEEGIILGGDLIVRVDGRDVGSPEDVAEAIEDNKPGDSIEIEFLRGRGRESVDLELAQRPAKAGAIDPRGGLGPPEDDDVLPLP
jgi:S1-C subfamily serine protease